MGSMRQVNVHMDLYYVFKGKSRKKAGEKLVIPSLKQKKKLINHRNMKSSCIRLKVTLKLYARIAKFRRQIWKELEQVQNGDHVRMGLN